MDCKINNILLKSINSLFFFDTYLYIYFRLPTKVFFLRFSIKVFDYSFFLTIY